MDPTPTNTLVLVAGCLVIADGATIAPKTGKKGKSGRDPVAVTLNPGEAGS